MISRLTAHQVMPSALAFWGGNLTLSVNNGSVPESRLTDMATRIMAAWYLVGQDSSEYPAPGIGMPANVLVPHTLVEARVPEARPVLFQSSLEGHVLVKNTNNALPLSKPKILSIFGYDAKAPDSITPNPTNRDWAFGLLSSSARYFICGFGNRIAQTCPAPLPIAANGTLYTGGGSGASTPPYISAPFNAIQERAAKEDTALYWDFVNINATAYVPTESDAAIVFINALASEGYDRPSLRDDFSDALVTNIAAQHNNTIVVIHNAGIRLVDQWIENPNVTAVIFAHLPGQDSGAALTQLLYGDVNPSGKLPYTVAKNESDYGRILNPITDIGANGEFYRFPQDDFTEGVYIDYRAFDASNIEPRYEFGFGLSYTTFSLSNLKVACVSGSPSEYPTGQVVAGGQADLWDIVASSTASPKTISLRAYISTTELSTLPISNQDTNLDSVFHTPLSHYPTSKSLASAVLLPSIPLVKLSQEDKLISGISSLPPLSVLPTQAASLAKKSPNSTCPYQLRDSQLDS